MHTYEYLYNMCIYIHASIYVHMCIYMCICICLHACINEYKYVRYAFVIKKCMLHMRVQTTRTYMSHI